MARLCLAPSFEQAIVGHRDLVRREVAHINSIRVMTATIISLVVRFLFAATQPFTECGSAARVAETVNLTIFDCRSLPLHYRSR